MLAELSVKIKTKEYVYVSGDLKFKEKDPEI